MNIPFERKNKLVGKGEREVNNNNKLLCLIFLKYIFELMINTAWPASNSVYQQNFKEKNGIKYKKFPT